MLDEKDARILMMVAKGLSKEAHKLSPNWSLQRSVILREGILAAMSHPRCPGLDVLK